MISESLGAEKITKTFLCQIGHQAKSSPALSDGIIWFTPSMIIKSLFSNCKVEAALCNFQSMNARKKS